MTPPLRPERSPAEYLMALRVSDPEKAQAFEAFLTERGQAHHIGIADRQMTYRSGGLERMNRNANAVDAERTPGEQVTTALNSALDAGTFGLAGLAADALSPGDFRANRDARKAEYGRLSTSDRVLSGLAGGLANPVSRVLPAIPASSGYLATAGRGALEGALQGAATGFGENVGTTEGAGMGTAIGAVGGAVGGAVLTPLAKALMARGGGVAEDATRRALDAQVADAGPVAPAAQAPMQSFRLARPTLQQTPLAPVPRNAPTPMAVDVAGPNMVANARGATSTVPGREGFRVPFEARAAAMPEAVTGDVPDAVALGNTLTTMRGEVADPAYQAAIEATKGQAVDSDLISAILTTPMGQKAFKAVAERRPNRVVAVGDPARALPTVERFKGPNLVDEPVPDAEALHEVKRQLSEWANLSPDVAAASGVDAIGAKDALGLFTRLRQEIPAPFRQADELYQEMSRPIDALEMGRQPWRPNPNPAAFKSEKLATTNAMDAYRGMGPREQVMVSTGKRYDLASRIREGKLSLADALAQMDNPQSTLATEMDVAGGGLGERIRQWAPVLSRQEQVLPSGQLAIEPTVNSAIAAVAEVADPYAARMGVRAARRMLGKSSAANMAERGAEDAAFAGLMTGRPETLADALANLAAKDQRVSRRLSGTAGAVGRMAGDKR